METSNPSRSHLTSFRRLQRGAVGLLLLTSSCLTDLLAQTAWTTLAGRPTGNEDGPGTAARFSLSDSGLAFDPAGNLIMAGSGSNTIRRIASDGTVSTVAGSGTAGYADGPASTVVRTVAPTLTTIYSATAVSDPHGPGTSTGAATVTVSGVAPSAQITAPAAANPGQGDLVASVPDAGPGATYAWTVTNGTITSGAGTRSITFSVTAFGGVRISVTVARGSCTMLGALTVPPAPPHQDYVLHFLGGQVAVAPATPDLALGSEFTIEAWVFALETGADQWLMEWPDDPTVGSFDRRTGVALVDQGTRLAALQSAGQPGSVSIVAAMEPIALQRWTHVAATLSSGTLRLFVNGTIQGTAESLGPPLPTNAPASIGGQLTADGRVWGGFLGALRQVRVWNRALTADDLQIEAGRHLTGAEPGLLACWPFDDGTSRWAHDLSPHDNPLRLFSSDTNRPLDQPTWWLVRDDGPFFVIDRVESPTAWGESCPVDFDSDGDLDIVTMHYDFETYGPMLLGALRNNGHAGFVDATDHVLGGISTIHARDWAVADFNGDGRQDVVIADHGPDRWPAEGAQSRLLIQSSDGRLVDETSSRLPRVDAFTHNVAVGDVEGDGDVDIYLANICCGAVGPQLLINDGSGHFKPDNTRLPPELRIAPREPGYPGNLSSARFIDVNRDHHPDLLLGAVAENQPKDLLLLNDGTGSFSHAPSGAMPPRHGDGTWVTQGEIAVVDVDLDGWPDALLATCNRDATEAFVQLLLNNRDGTFREASDRIPQNWPRSENSAGSWLQWIPVTDFNGDEWPDFVTIGSAGMHLYLNDQGKRFVDVSTILPMGPTFLSGRPVSPAPGSSPDFVFLGSGPGSAYYVARNLKPYALAQPRPRRHLSRAQAAPPQ